MEQGLEMNSMLKESRDYKNPSFLKKAVDILHIDQYGSAYPPEVFDPRDLNPEVCPCIT